MRGKAMRAVPSLLPLSLQHVAAVAGTTRILDDVTLDIAAGPPTVIMGPNGSGKTTLLRLMMGLMPPAAGRITYASSPQLPSARIAIVFQRPVMLRRTAAANVAFALAAAGKPIDPATVRQRLAEVGLEAIGERPARRLSGGEQQRLAFARALARDPELLLLDEPTASLDPAQTHAVEDIIARIAASGVKVVMTTHDIGQARRLAGEIVLIARRRVAEHAPAQTFLTSPASEDAQRFLAGELIL